VDALAAHAELVAVIPGDAYVASASRHRAIYRTPSMAGGYDVFALQYGGDPTPVAFGHPTEDAWLVEGEDAVLIWNGGTSFRIVPYGE